MPTFSVIINNYNYRGFLEHAIRSILQQDFRDYELIVVDDGSDDGSVEYIQSLHYPLTLVQTKRSGQAEACRSALGKATGDYIYILDADDFAFPGLLSAVAALLADRPAKIQFQLQPVRADGTALNAPFPIYPAAYDASAQRSEISRRGVYLTPPTSGNIFRRDIFQHIWPIDYETAIDGVALLLSPYLGPTVSLGQVYAGYRVHSGGHSIHGDVIDTRKIERDANRFRDRLLHLQRIGTELGLRIVLGPPERHFFYLDQLSIQGVLEGKSVRRLLPAWFLALLRENGLSRFTLRKMSWFFAMLTGPNFAARDLARYRLNLFTR